MGLRRAWLGLLVVVTAAVGDVAWAAEAPAYVQAAVAGASRTADERKLDDRRKPAEVLAFAGVKPGQTVGEYLPGGGYYTRMLSAVVGPGGKVHALETTTWGQENVDLTRKAVADLKNVTLDLAPLGQFSLPEKVDVFWTTLNYHDLHVPKYAAVDMAVFNKHVFESLKPGGTYFIVDHAAAADTGASASPTLHRIERATVIKEVTAAGFKLEGESPLLANPQDDHAKAVFDPAVRGKTDQFILKFRRP